MRIESEDAHDLLDSVAGVAIVRAHRPRAGGAAEHYSCPTGVEQRAGFVCIRRECAHRYRRSVCGKRFRDGVGIRCVARRLRIFLGSQPASPPPNLHCGRERDRGALVHGISMSVTVAGGWVVGRFGTVTKDLYPQHGLSSLQRGDMIQTLEPQIVDAEDRLRTAMLSSDVSSLDALLAPELIFTNHLGQLQGKEKDLAAYRSGMLKVEELEPSERQVRLYGEVAIVSVRMRMATFALRAFGLCLLTKRGVL